MADFESTRQVQVRVLESRRVQLVYRQEVSEAPSVVVPSEVQVYFCEDWSSTRGRFRDLRTLFGFWGALKAVAKIMTPSRYFYYATLDGVPVHYGWICVGWCKYYPVREQDVTMGPIWSDPNARGKGVATAATLFAISEMSRRGYSVFYGDTMDDNWACRKVMDRCGFGEPIAVLPRWR
jgi:GNAT superfamily N-acetyltransferase